MNLTEEEKKLLINYAGFYGYVPDVLGVSFRQECHNMCCILDNLDKTFGYDYVSNIENGCVFSSRVNELVDSLESKKKDVLNFYLSYFYDLKNGLIVDERFTKLKLLTIRMAVFDIRKYSKLAEALNYIKENNNFSESDLDKYLSSSKFNEKVVTKTPRDFDSTHSKDIISFLKNEEKIATDVNYEIYYRDASTKIEMTSIPEKTNTLSRLLKRLGMK